MSLLVNFTEAVIDDKVTELNGRTTSRPTLFVGDEANNEFYVVNVDIGEDQEMRDVAIAAGNNELRYAESSSPVTLQKVAGHWTVTGFSKTMPGTRVRVPVTVPDFRFGLPTYTKGVVVDLTTTVRALTYGELAIFGVYGEISAPYGALGRFVGGVFQEVFT